MGPYCFGFFYFIIQRRSLSKRTMAQIFWFHFSAISDLLDLAFSFCVFRKDLQTQSSSVSPAAVGWLNHRMMRTMCSEKKTHCHLITCVLHNSFMQLFRETGRWKQTETGILTFGCAVKHCIHWLFCVCLNFSLNYIFVSLSLSLFPSLALLARQHVNDAPHRS